MDWHYRKNILASACLSFLIGLVLSCERINLDDLKTEQQEVEENAEKTDKTEEPTSSVALLSLSLAHGANETLILLFDSSGTCLQKIRIAGEDTIDMHLEKGVYKIVGISDYKDFDVHLSPQWTMEFPLTYDLQGNLLTTPTCDSPIKFSSVNIDLSKDTRLQLFPCSVMAEVCLKYEGKQMVPEVLLTDIPWCFNLLDSTSTCPTSTIVLSQNAVYIFPTQLPPSVKIGNESFLLPQNLYGGKSYDIIVSDSEGAEGYDVALEEYDFDSEPVTPCLYNGHVAVAKTEEGVLCLSLREWSDLSAGSALVEEYVRGYAEGGISGWRQPTREEAKMIRTAVGEDLGTLNGLLSSVGGMALSTDFRYLCESSTYSFSFAPNTSVTKVGSKKADYRLRLVRSFRVKVKG